jgi:hypothetical protein
VKTPPYFSSISFINHKRIHLNTFAKGNFIIQVMKSLFVFLTISLFFVSCERTSCENAQAATIEDYTGLDGCGLVIKLQSGEVLEPINLNDFNITPTDGMKVWVKYHEVGMMSICMVGPTVEIDCLSKR